jgi:hypothetical protein
LTLRDVIGGEVELEVLGLGEDLESVGSTILVLVLGAFRDLLFFYFLPPLVK